MLCASIGTAWTARSGAPDLFTGSDRYPTNEDSLGIEIVGAFDAKGQTYDTVNREQNDALVWLVDVLETKLTLTAGDVYAHGGIGYKQPSEAASAQWKKP